MLFILTIVMTILAVASLVSGMVGIGLIALGAFALVALALVQHRWDRAEGWPDD